MAELKRWAKMKLWISAEMDADVADLWRTARIVVETAINVVIGKKEYVLPIDSWDCIGIIRNDQEFPERIMFSRKKRKMDFRLRVPHSAFKIAGIKEREKMIFEMLERSLTILRSKTGESDGFEALALDLRAIAKSNGWIAS